MFSKLFIFTSLILTSCAQFEVFKNSASDSSSPQLGHYAQKVRLRLMENIPNYRFCLEKYIIPSEDGEFKGAVTFSFLINKHGMVKNVTIISDKLKNLKAKGCLIKALTTMEMPKHNKAKDFEVRQPIGISLK